MKKSKHMKDKEKRGYKKVVLFSIIIIIIFVLILCKDTIFIKNIVINTSKEGNSSKIEKESSVENEKLVLKSNYEENKKREITYIFKENKVFEVIIFEKYINEEIYIKEKEKISKRVDIEIIEINDKELQFQYKKLKLGSDEGLSYEQIYNKYMGIIGAYEKM